MKVYAEHFTICLEAELAAEQAQLLAHRKLSKHSYANSPFLLRGLQAKKRKRIFSSAVYSLLIPKRKAEVLSNDFSKGDLVDVGPDMEYEQSDQDRVQAVVLSVAPNAIRVTVPIASDASRYMDSFVEHEMLLRAESGTSTIAFERATEALSVITERGPASAELARLIVMSFAGSIEIVPKTNPAFVDVPRQYPKLNDEIAQANKWSDLATETVRRIPQQNMNTVLKFLPASLNASQKKAIRQAFRSRLTLIQGPPGTGKTVTAAHLISCLTKLGTGAVLACAASNVATDNLMRAILQACKGRRIRVVRIGRVAAIDEDLWENTLDCLVEANPKVRSLRKAVEQCEVQPSEMYEVEREVSATILRSADVVVSTCVGCGRDELNGLKFGTVLVDEATQATEPDVLIALSATDEMATQVVMVGDHHQLAPTTLSRFRDECGFGLETSLFLRLWQSGIECELLNVQYRMHPDIAAFASQHFYFGLIRNGIKEEDRQLCLATNVLKEKRVMFCNVSDGAEERDSSRFERVGGGKSFVNRAEADAVIRIIQSLVVHNGSEEQGRFEESDLGVISPYAGQVRHLKASMYAWKSDARVEICSVDGFQGREKDIIVVSCVRSNEGSAVGFLADWRRLNVAITRARVLLIVVGDEKTLGADEHWRAWLKWVRKYSGFVNLTQIAG